MYEQKYAHQYVKDAAGDDWQKGIKTLSGLSPSSPFKGEASPERMNQIKDMEKQVEQERKELEHMKAGGGNTRDSSPRQTPIGQAKT